MYRMLLLSFFFGMAFIACNEKQENTGGWYLVYENNSAGKKVTGSKDDLKKAIDQGCPVRLAWTVNLSDSSQIRHLTDASFLSVHVDEVFAQVEEIVRQIPQRKKPMINLDTLHNLKWHAIIGTTGEMRSTFSGTESNRVKKVQVKWYINDKDCPLNSNEL